ncbi:MAG: O-methyltransferase [Mogibacterium sp.]|nr:O-methyltransferase [Mogibacterium sp.]
MPDSITSKEFIEQQYKPLNEELARLRELNETDGVPLILRETEGMLSVLLDICKPERILEIGTAYGYSAAFFAAKCPNALITTIERNPKMIEKAVKCFEMLGLDDRVELLEGDAAEILRGIGENADTTAYDLVFIDAGKTHYREYLELSERLCRAGSLIVCDNILIHGWIYDRKKPGAKRHRTSVKYMKSFLKYIKDREDLTVSVSESGDGLAIIRLNDK